MSLAHYRQPKIAAVGLCFWPSLIANEIEKRITKMHLIGKARGMGTELSTQVENGYDMISYRC